MVSHTPLLKTRSHRVAHVGLEFAIFWPQSSESWKIRPMKDSSSQHIGAFVWAAAPSSRPLSTAAHSLFTVYTLGELSCAELGYGL